MQVDSTWHPTNQTTQNDTTMLLVILFHDLVPSETREQTRTDVARCHRFQGHEGGVTQVARVQLREIYDISEIQCRANSMETKTG